MSVSGGPNLSEDGLVLLYDFGNPKSYRSGSSTVVNLSNLPITGTIISSTPPVTASSQNAGTIIFPPVRSEITCDALSTYIQSGSFSISSWIKFTTPHTTASRNAVIVHIADNPSNNDMFFSFGASGSDNRLGNGVVGRLTHQMYSTTGWQVLTGSREYWSESIWYNVATVVDTINNKWTLFVNGVPDTTRTLPTRTITVPSVLARVFGSNRYPFSTSPGILTGSAGPLVIYNRGLSTGEVLQNFNAQRSRFGV
jgi:hypothetical protein